MKIFVSRRADLNFRAILNYLRKEWSEKVAEAFIQKTTDIFELLEQFPEMGQLDVEDKQIRGFQLTKQIQLLYRIKGDRLIVISFFDVRQNPGKRPQ